MTLLTNYFIHSSDHVFKIFLKSFYRKFIYREISRNVLGIETSCDDTGAAIINENGELLAEQLNSQTAYHVEKGGINPPHAKELHISNIDNVVSDTLKQANMTMEDISVIATTTRPGLAQCLTVGLNYSLGLIQKYKTPFIPIHHMQAHALTPRFENHIPFPYLVLLMSGGHCLLVVAKRVDEFILLGSSCDDAPGDAFDKVARRLRLKDLPNCKGLSGGVAIELMARGGDVTKYPITNIMNQAQDCNFSFAGLKTWTVQQIEKEEQKQGLPKGFGHLENLADFCASFQHNVFRHIAKRVQRSILFCELKGLLKHQEDGVGDTTTNEKRKFNLVLSGGVASNHYGRSVIQKVCEHYDFNLICPPPRLCTDNGLMIAWNGVELLRENKGFSKDPTSELIYPKFPIGKDISTEVANSFIKLPRIKLT